MLNKVEGLGPLQVISVCVSLEISISPISWLIGRPVVSRLNEKRERASNGRGYLLVGSEVAFVRSAVRVQSIVAELGPLLS